MQILYYADSSIEYNEWTKVRGETLPKEEETFFG